MSSWKRILLLAVGAACITGAYWMGQEAGKVYCVELGGSASRPPGCYNKLEMLLGVARPARLWHAEEIVFLALVVVGGWSLLSAMLGRSLPWQATARRLPERARRTGLG